MLFSGTAAAVALAVLAAGWFTGLRAVAHGAMITVAVLALLPLIIIGGGLLLILLLTLVMALFGGEDADGGMAADGVVEAGGWLLPRYYRFLARQRHPVFWGVPTGTLLGGLLLWAVLALAVIPHEARTVSILLQAKQGAEAAYKQHKRFPRPNAQGQLPCATVDLQDHEACDGGVVTDGFGRPLGYAVQGRWRLSSFRLTSLGFDGEPGRDDLCAEGASRLARAARAASDLLTALLGEDPKRLSLEHRLQGVKALRCDK